MGNDLHNILTERKDLNNKVWFAYRQGMNMNTVLVINTIGFGFRGFNSVVINYLSHMDRQRDRSLPLLLRLAL